MVVEYYFEIICVVFQEFWLVEGMWDVEGECVWLQDIKYIVLMMIEGEFDDILGSGQIYVVYELCMGIL